MKLGCVVSTPDVEGSSLALLAGTFDEKVAKARALGYVGVELMVRDPSRLDAEEIKATLASHGLEVPQIVTGEVFGADRLALVHADPATCQAAMCRLQAIIRLASILAPGTMVNVGRVRGRMDWLNARDEGEARSRFVTTFRDLADYAATYSVRVTLEPCNRYEVDFVQNERDGLEVVLEVNRPNFGLMLDVFHMNIEEPSIEGSLRAAASALWHVHIADSNRLPPGEGHIDFRGIVATLHAIGYEGYLSGEMRPVPDPDTAARMTMNYMRQWV